MIILVFFGQQFGLHLETLNLQDFAVDKLELDWLQRAQKKPSLVLGCSNESLRRLLSDILQ